MVHLTQQALGLRETGDWRALNQPQKVPEATPTLPSFSHGAYPKSDAPRTSSGSAGKGKARRMVMSP